jgi:hypothetical protein
VSRYLHAFFVPFTLDLKLFYGMCSFSLNILFSYRIFRFSRLGVDSSLTLRNFAKWNGKFCTKFRKIK